jgi:hypothetical protein
MEFLDASRSQRRGASEKLYLRQISLPTQILVLPLYGILSWMLNLGYWKPSGIQIQTLW